MNKVLVTGANGFIGSHMMKLLREKGYDVTGWDIVPNDAARIYRVDMLKEDFEFKLKDVSPDMIIHCAGMANVGVSIKKPIDDYESNVTVTYRLLESLRKCNLRDTRLVFMSSAGVYGQPERLPIKEEQSLVPLSPYALHKKMAEDICAYYFKEHQIDIKIARIFSAYGPGLRKQIFWDMNVKANKYNRLEMFGTGDESRDFIYIDDLAEAIYLILTKTDRSELVFNVANGEEITIRYAAEVFGACKGISDINFNGVVREGDPLNWQADIDKLKRLGYARKTSFEEGVSKYVDWCGDK